MGPGLYMDTETAHCTTGALGLGGPQFTIRVSDYLTVYRRYRDIEVKGQLEKILPLKDGEWT